MEVFKAEATNVTPSIDLNPSTGVLEMKGRSIPENSLEFYQPIFEWLDAYVKAPSEKTVVHLRFDYFNTSSSKCILDILKRIDKINLAGNDVFIKWYHDESDEDMMEAGEDYSDLLDSPFEIIVL